MKTKNLRPNYSTRLARVLVLPLLAVLALGQSALRAQNYIWTGAATTEWSTNVISGLKNWQTNSTATDYKNGVPVVFDDSTSSNTVMLAVADVQPASVLFSNATKTYTLQGSKAIAGTAGLSVNGAGVVNLLNTNTYTGPTVINAGTLNIGSATVDGKIADGVVTNSGGNFNYYVPGGYTNTYGGLLYGIYPFGKYGTGTLIYTGTNFGGSTMSVSGGELDLAGGNGTNSLYNLTVSSSSTLRIVSGTCKVSYYYNLTPGTNAIIQTGGSVIVSSGYEMDVMRVGSSHTAGSYSLSGGSLSTPTLTMSELGDNTLGTFNLSGTGSVSATALYVGDGGGAGYTNDTTVFNQSGGTVSVQNLYLGGSSTQPRTTSTLNISGGSFTATNILLFVGNANSTNTTLLGGTAQVSLPAFPVPVGTANLTLDFTTGYLSPLAASTSYLGGLTGAFLTANGANFNVASGKNITVAQAFQDAPGQAGAFQKTGAGTLTLSGTNTYTGKTTVNAGTLVVQQAYFSTNSAVSVAAGAVLNLSFSGTNKIGRLVLNGVTQTNGIYNASTSPTYLAGTGSLQIVGPGNFSRISVNGTGLTLNVTNGTPGGSWTLLMSTNLLLPVAQWPTNRTGNYDGSGNLTTNILNGATNPAAFYLLK